MKYTILLILALVLCGMGTANAQDAKLPFKKAFAKARKEFGAKGVFRWNGKLYTTEYAEEVQTPTHTEVSIPPQPNDNRLRPITTMDSVFYAMGVDFGRYLKERQEELKSDNARPLDINIVFHAIDDKVKNRRTAIFADTLSYAEGEIMGNYAVKMNEQHTSMNLPILNIPMFRQATVDVLDSRPYFTQPEAIAFVDDFYSNGILAVTRKNADEYIATVARDNPTIKATDSGLLYEIIRPGNMNIRAQTDTDQVKVSYVGTRRDGTIFDQNEDIIFRLSDVIKGWAEGIKLIGKGGKIKLILHPDLAYEDKNLGKITPNSVLIFNIVLKDVIRDTDRDSD